MCSDSHDEASSAFMTVPGFRCERIEVVAAFSLLKTAGRDAPLRSRLPSEGSLASLGLRRVLKSGRSIWRAPIQKIYAPVIRVLILDFMK